MSDNTIQNVQGVALAILLVGLVFWFVISRLRRSRPDFRIGKPIAIGYAIRLVAIVGISATGLDATLRGGDEITFINWGRYLATQPLGHGYLPHGPYQLQTVLFALQFKLGFLTIGALRVTQVGIAMLGVILILAAVHDLAGARASRLGAWLLMLEPVSIFFNSALHKEPLMELATGLVVFGGTIFWKRLDLRAIVPIALGGLIAVWTRSYAGWFLVSAAVLVLLHGSLRNINRPLRVIPVLFAVVAIIFVATPAILEASSSKHLKQLQASQVANSTGAGETSVTANGSNGSNLALEKVDFSTRGAIITNLPKRIRDVLLKPYPWQLGDASQQVGALGTLIAYVVLIFLVRYMWLSRGEVFSRAGPILYPMFFLLVAYSLAAGNAGTGFRYRSHLVTLGIAAMVVLRQRVLDARAEAVTVPLPAENAGVGVKRVPVAV
jgi:hypothetical protein